MLELKPYKHYQGGTYVVLGIAYNATSGAEAERLVTYQCAENGTLFVREEAEFFEDVEPGVRRFEPLFRMMSQVGCAPIPEGDPMSDEKAAEALNKLREENSRLRGEKAALEAEAQKLQAKCDQAIEAYNQKEDRISQLGFEINDAMSQIDALKVSANEQQAAP